MGLPGWHDAGQPESTTSHGWGQTLGGDLQSDFRLRGDTAQVVLHLQNVLADQGQLVSHDANAIGRNTVGGNTLAVLKPGAYQLAYRCDLLFEPAYGGKVGL